MSKLGKVKDISQRLENIKVEVDCMATEARSKYDEHSENWKCSEKGDAFDEKISYMEEASSYIQDAIDALENAS